MVPPWMVLLLAPPAPGRVRPGQHPWSGLAATCHGHWERSKKCRLAGTRESDAWAASRSLVSSLRPHLASPPSPSAVGSSGSSHWWAEQGAGGLSLAWVPGLIRGLTSLAAGQPGF